MFEKLFQTLFLYRPVVFQQGEFRFDITTGSFVALALVGLVVLLAIATYRRVGFRPVGIMRRYERGPDGTFHDGLLMDMLEGELT